MCWHNDMPEHTDMSRAVYMHRIRDLRSDRDLPVGADLLQLLPPDHAGDDDV